MKFNKINLNFRSSLIFLISCTIYFIGLIPTVFIAKIFFINFNINSYIHLFLVPLVFIFLLLIVILSEVFIISLVIKLFHIKYEEGKYELDLRNKTFFKYTLFTTLSYPITKIIKLFGFVPIYILFIKLLGAKIGKNTFLIGTINNPSLTEIGDNCVIGGHVIISSHVGENKFILKKVKIGNNCIIGSGAYIMPGVIMEDYSVLAARGVAIKNQVLKEKTSYGGVPAKVIKKLEEK